LPGISPREEFVSAELAQQLRRKGATRTQLRSGRARAVSGLGPLTAFAGIVWAVVQPDRITLLHPHGQGFWWLLSESPLFVVAAGVLFHVLVAVPLARELQQQSEEGG
jgi:hypothetical protein